MGKIVQINVKDKKQNEVGLPKYPVERANVTKDGMVGDFNNYRHDKLKNTPDQALLIMTSEMIKKLNEEGWPIQSGDIGENLTIKGIPYTEFQPESKFKVGNVVFQVTYACTPCHNLEHLPYVGKEKADDFIKTMVDRRGWYAKVLQEGNINVGDVLEKF